MPLQSWPKIPLADQHLRRLRLSVPMGMDALARAAGCSYGHLRRLETTAYRPSPELAERLAQALSVELGRPVSRYEFFEDRVPRPRKRAS